MTDTIDTDAASITTTDARTFGPDEHALLVALVYCRFGRDDEAARAAWSRMLQNDGWDESETARAEWRAMVERGMRGLRSCGFRNLTD